jgi:glycosyltransferase involved in cell wall biosynthesis
VRILILNWRCPLNPRAGGAEFLTFQIAKRLVASGHEVEWFSAAFPGSLPKEALDGVRLVRAGRQWTVHLHAFLRYFRRLNRRFDLVIDEVNTVPFFTPLWADIPVFMLIYQLAREVWWYESRFPISLLGFILEPLYLRLYKRVPVFTESKSTLEDLRRLGFSGSITVLPVGVDCEGVIEVGSTNRLPNFVYVGRLSPSKRVHDIIRAFALFRRTVPEARLWLVGDGPKRYVQALCKLALGLQLETAIDFCGRLGQDQKYERMAGAYALLMASVREGWGLVVTEANAMGTPAVVYDVAGLRDSVLHERTGLLVSPSPSALAEGMLRIWRDRDLYVRLVSEAAINSRDFSFDHSAAVVTDFLRSQAPLLVR